METKKVIIENKAVSKENTVVKFGFGQITKPTPEMATKIFRVILYAAAIASAAAKIFSAIPQDVKVMIWQYSSESVAFTHMITKMFGLDVKDPEK